MAIMLATAAIAVAGFVYWKIDAAKHEPRPASLVSRPGQSASVPGEVLLPVGAAPRNRSPYPSPEEFSPAASARMGLGSLPGENAGVAPVIRSLPGATDPAYGFSFFTDFPRVTYWWNGVPEEVQSASLKFPGISNLRRADYAGAKACRDCHPGNYEKWSKHSHRWMNALANAQTVKGDFSGKASMDYLGGKVHFFTETGGYRMRLSRAGTQRVYSIERTIGSRYFQYYVGRLLEGPEPPEHAVRRIDHLLPFGYWLDQREWVPVVHVDDERPDGKRDDPFARCSPDPYDQSCSVCHTTRPMGDWLLNKSAMERMQNYLPHRLSFLASAYLQQNHSNDLPRELIDSPPLDDRFGRLAHEVKSLPARESAVTLGVSCEACHNGARSHAEFSTPKQRSHGPFFSPSGPLVFVQSSQPRSAVWGRSPENLNFICSRCHSGGRPTFANGISTWNSVEYSDAIQGHCFLGDPAKNDGRARLTCVHCHNPHQTIGQQWSHLPAEDDARCFTCHKKLEAPVARQAHTHHADGSPGANCMNCHMPKINESMQQLVRTHTIFNPTDARMIEANQPNACNLCHLDKPIDWTLRYLREWYQAPAFDEARLKTAYPDRAGATGLGWLKSPHESTRLVAAEALARAKADWALPRLLDVLDDPFLLNRQFTARRLEEWRGVNLRDFGYHFYQLPDERRAPLERVRTELLKKSSASLR